jgi:hypothetical protein
MLKIMTLAIASVSLLLFVGCGSVRTASVPAPKSVERLTDSQTFLMRSTADPFPSSLGRLSPNTKRDYTIYQGLKVISEEGKKRGYKYFALTYPPLLDNISGSSLNSPDEVFYLCGAVGMREFLTTSSQCNGINRSRGISTHYSAVFFHEKPVDFVVWDIKETLQHPKVASTDSSFEYDPVPPEELH